MLLATAVLLSTQICSGPVRALSLETIRQQIPLSDKKYGKLSEHSLRAHFIYASRLQGEGQTAAAMKEFDYVAEKRKQLRGKDEYALYKVLNTRYYLAKRSEKQTPECLTATKQFDQFLESHFKDVFSRNELKVLLEPETEANRAFRAKVYSKAARLMQQSAGGQEDHNLDAVIANMRLMQVVASSYANDHKGFFPTDLSKTVLSYFPGGDANAGKLGVGPTNPYSGKAEYPVLGHVTDVAKARQTAPSKMRPGEIEYTPIDNGRTYAIRGGDGSGLALEGTLADATTVFSNHCSCSDEKTKKSH